jgi:hypothetical protein
LPAAATPFSTDTARFISDIASEIVAAETRAGPQPVLDRVREALEHVFGGGVLPFGILALQELDVVRAAGILARRTARRAGGGCGRGGWDHGLRGRRENGE